MDRLTVRLAGIIAARFGAGILGAANPEYARPRRRGAAVRDEILKYHASPSHQGTQGRFMEEWHQKLHNNTTSDDVVICEAFLAFLHSKGDVAVFYSTLDRAGVTRDRRATLNGRSRPIRNIFRQRRRIDQDFTRYLEILKSVHSGTDFNSAFAAASRHLSADLKKNISEVRNGADAVFVAERLTTAREALAASFTSMKDDAALRDLLFLDLALEALFRQAIEKQELGSLPTEKVANFWNSPCARRC